MLGLNMMSSTSRAFLDTVQPSLPNLYPWSYFWGLRLLQEANKSSVTMRVSVPTRHVQSVRWQCKTWIGAVWTRKVSSLSALRGIERTHPCTQLSTSHSLGSCKRIWRIMNECRIVAVHSRASGRSEVFFARAAGHSRADVLADTQSGCRQVQFEHGHGFHSTGHFGDARSIWEFPQLCNGELQPKWVVQSRRWEFVFDCSAAYSEWCKARQPQAGPATSSSGRGSTLSLSITSRKNIRFYFWDDSPICTKCVLVHCTTCDMVTFIMRFLGRIISVYNSYFSIPNTSH